MTDDQQRPRPQGEVVSRAQVRKKNLVTIPREVRDALGLREGDEVEFTVHPNGDVTLRGMTVVPIDQRWFWEPEWQAGEREASAAIAAGETTVDYSTEDFLAALDTLDADA
ncbi:AbrB/MazE/SpoVT family DNA-binding domain-containing protein [Kibdelosporangium aridum]|uniref:AbrB/MazE/SpoVT family DNA-binding domain-containing protein n=1 Tax=Kibdelosporangium aridum TaxID=2030 RepID=UPI0035E6C79B